MGQLKILLPILLGIFVNVILSQSEVEVDPEAKTEAEIISHYKEMAQNGIDERLPINYLRSKRQTENIPRNDSFKPSALISRKLMSSHPFQTDAPPIYSVANSPAEIADLLSYVTEGYFDQYVDHNDRSKGTFKQKYLLFSKWCQHILDYDDDYRYYPKHPQVFATFGVESAASKTDFFTYGFFMDDAKKYNACCVELEHRQYGESVIGIDASVKNMEFLRTDQALDDMARFVEYFNYEYNIKYKKWAFYGCSLSGGYVSRFAVRHPEVYEFGIAAAACRQTFYDFHHYMDTVSDVLGYISSGCREIMSKAFGSMTDLVNEAREVCKTNQSSPNCTDTAMRNTEILVQYLRICGNFNILSEINMQDMTYSAFYYLTFLVQYNKVINNILGVTVQDFCATITSLETDPNNPYDNLRKFSEANCFIVKKLFGIPDFIPCDIFCFIFLDWEVEVDYCRQTDWNDPANAQGQRQWQWQICEYFVNFITTSGPYSAFGKLLTTFFYQKSCNDCFKNRFNSIQDQLTVSENNKLYGGLKGIRGNCPSCTLFVVHEMDPWKGCGVLHPNDINCGGYDNKFVFYSNGSHCSTTYPDSIDDKNDSNLKDAKIKIHEAIDHWMTRGCKYPTPVKCPR